MYVRSGQGGSGEEAGETAGMITLPLSPSHRDEQLVFLTEEERASLAQIDLSNSEPSDSSLLEKLFSSDISSVYRLGKGMSLLVVRCTFCQDVPLSHNLNTGHVCFDVKVLFVSQIVMMFHSF